MPGSDRSPRRSSRPAAANPRGRTSSAGIRSKPERDLLQERGAVGVAPASAGQTGAGVGRIRAVLSSAGSFPRKSRILHRPEFQRAQRFGVRIRTSALTIVAMPTSVGRPRLGLAVSKKVGSAPIRNRIKRMVREAFRRAAGSLTSVDFVVIAQSEAAGLVARGFDAVCEVLLPALARATERAEKARGGR